MAIAALVTSLLGLLCGIGFVVGLILGYVARSQIRQSQGRQTGEGLALAAIIIGWVGIALTILFIVMFVGGMLAFGDFGL